MFTVGIKNEDTKLQPRKPAFRFLGHTFAGLLIILFLLVYSILSYQKHAWRHYFFQGTMPLADKCFYAAVGSSSIEMPKQLLSGLPLTKVEIPHSRDLLPREIGQQAYYHVHYRCQFEPPKSFVGSGVVYLHAGWIFGQETSIYINRELRVSSFGNDKPIIPLNRDDLRKNPIEMDIWVSSPTQAFFGLVGAQPMVIASGTAINSRILGIETSFQNVGHLLTLLPLLTLGLVLVFGWAMGNHSRLMLGAFFFFVASSLHDAFLLFSDIWPWGLEFTYFLSNPLKLGAGLAFVVFGTQILGLLQRHLLRLIAISIMAVVAEIALIVFLPNPYAYLSQVLEFNRASSVLSAFLIIIFGIRNLKAVSLERSRRSVNIVFLTFTSVFSSLLLLEILLASIGKDFTVFVQLVYLFMPIFVGGVLLYTLSLIERQYQQEKILRQRMERDLDLAREIQDSLTPPPAHSYAGNLQVVCHQIKHHQVAGDWMAVREMPDGDIVVIVADATGKGLQAALVVHAVQSLWADTLGQDVFDARNWLLRVNRSLVRLGEQKKHSMTLGIAVIKKKSLVYWSAGHIPLFVVLEEKTEDGVKTNIKPIMAKGSVVGLSPEVELEESTFDLPEHTDITMMLGSDGVFTKGSRSSRRDIAEILTNLEKEGQEALKKCLSEDDKTLVLIKRSSSRSEAQKSY